MHAGPEDLYYVSGHGLMDARGPRLYDLTHRAWRTCKTRAVRWLVRGVLLFDLRPQLRLQETREWWREPFGGEAVPCAAP